MTRNVTLDGGVSKGFSRRDHVIVTWIFMVFFKKINFIVLHLN